MGNSSSSTTASPSIQQQDLQFLAERLPFGDAELHHLYKVYQRMLTRDQTAIQEGDVTKDVKDEEGSSAQVSLPPSFLVDWAVECTNPQSFPSNTTTQDRGDASSNIQDLKKERETLLRVVESQILPLGFGNRLYRVAFVVPGDSVYPYDEAALESSENNPSKSRPSSIHVDEYTRRSRLEAFFQGLSNCSRRGAKTTLQVLFDCCHGQTIGQANDASSTSQSATRWIEALEFVALGYQLALASAFLLAADRDDVHMTSFLVTAQSTEDDANDEASQSPKNDETLRALAQSIVERARTRRQRTAVLDTSHTESFEEAFSRGLVTLDDLLDWSDTVAPVFASILPTFLFQVFFPGRPYPPSRTAFDFPRIPVEETDQDTRSSTIASSFFSSPSCTKLFTFGCLSSSLDGLYYRLYTSDSDGLSFNRLMNALLGYGGPTLLLIRSCSSNGCPGGVFGAFTASPWKESKDFYGNSDCFLFQVSPLTSVYRPTGNDQNFMYCNSSARSRGYDQQAHGIGFGGTTQQPRLFLAESLDDGCMALSQDLTFENGSLLPKTESGTLQKSFVIESLEVWGVGGDDVVLQALGARDRARQIKDEGIRRARKVDKAQFLDDFRSGAVYSKAFQHRQQIDGRADQDVEDRHKTQYSYEK